MPYVLSHIKENIMEACVLASASRHLGSHACSQLIHERQKLVGWDLLHPFLKKTKITEAASVKTPIIRPAKWLPVQNISRPPAIVEIVHLKC